MNQNLKNMLSESVCTGLNSIVYGDGAMVLFNLGFDENRQRFIWPIVDAQLESYLKYNGDDLAPFDVFAKTRWENLEICVGDSSSEGSGVIYVIDTKSLELIWFLCFENSEAFTAVSVDGDVILATTATQEVWRVPVNKPLALR